MISKILPVFDACDFRRAFCRHPHGGGDGARGDVFQVGVRRGPHRAAGRRGGRVQKLPRPPPRQNHPHRTPRRRQDTNRQGPSRPLQNPPYHHKG